MKGLMAGAPCWGYKKFSPVSYLKASSVLKHKHATCRGEIHNELIVNVRLIDIYITSLTSVHLTLIRQFEKKMKKKNVL